MEWVGLRIIGQDRMRMMNKFKCRKTSKRGELNRVNAEIFVGHNVITIYVQLIYLQFFLDIQLRRIYND